jgi:GNAT superfamily N-acetyltransferase
LDVIVRKSQTDDLDSILGLYPHLLLDDLPAPSLLESKTIWQEILANPIMSCLIAELNGTPVGTCCVLIVPNLTRGGRPYSLIENVVVHTEYQNKGIGRALIEEAIRLAKAANCYKIMLLSGVDNKNHGFYERLGFSRYSKVGFEIRML